MSAPESVAVRVIYDSTQRPGRRRGPVTYVSRRSATKFILSLGVLNLAIAAALYYTIWWQVDPFIYMTFMLRTPIITEHTRITVPPIGIPFQGGSGAREMTGEEMIGSIFGLRPEDALTREPSERSTTDAPESSEPLTMRWSNSTSQKVIPAVGYGWLTLATIGCCAVALAAGASIASGLRTRSGARIIGLLIVLFLIGGLTYGAYVGFTRYLVGYPVEYLRYGMGGLALLAGAIGLAISPQGRGLRRVTRLAACLLIISAVASAVGVYLWRQAGAIEPQYATAAMLALIFAAHSAWGWVLFIFSFRI